MNQQINLNRFLPQKIRSSLTFGTIVFLYFVLFFLLMMLSFYGFVIKLKDQKNIIEATQELAITQIKLAEINKKYKVPTIKVSDKAACDTRFSLYLQTFAKTIVQGVWLVNIEINNGGKQINLKGHALQADQVERFLSQLQQDKLFSGLTFELVELTELTSATATPGVQTKFYNFYISTKIKT